MAEHTAMNNNIMEEMGGVRRATGISSVKKNENHSGYQGYS